MSGDVERSLHDPEALVGAVLGGRFRIDRLVGRGGMGVVYAATQTDLARRVALKVFPADGGDLDGIEREARAAAQLAHPHIVQVTDFVDDGEHPAFLVMELLEGESLEERLARQGRLAPDRAVQIAVQTLSALAAAHAAGIVHRDVKPANVFLTRTALTDDFVKLLDFGVARVVSSPTARSLDASRGPVGTPAFMAPEQVTVRPVDERTDIWAVGVSLYVMLTGRAPFEGSTLPELLACICHDAPPPIGELAPEVPPELVAVVDRALHKDPAGRWTSAEAFRAALVPLARHVALPSRALGAAPAAPATVAAAETVEDVGATALMPAAVETVSLPGAPTQRDAPPSEDTLASPPEASSPRAFVGGHTMQSTMPSNRPLDAGEITRRRRRARVVVAGAAAIVCAALAGVAARRFPREPRASSAGSASAAVDASSGPPAAAVCTIGAPYAPWPAPRGRLSVAAAGEEVVVGVETSDAPARVLLARAAGPSAPFDALDLGTILDLPNDVDVRGGVATTGGRATLGAFRAVAEDPVPRDGARSTFVTRDVRPGVRSLARLERTGHRSHVTAVTSFGTAMILASAGDERAAPKALTNVNLVEPALRLVVVDGPRFQTLGVLEHRPAVDVAVAAARDLIAVAVSWSGSLEVRMFDPRTLQNVPVASRLPGARDPTIAVVGDEAVAAWMDAAGHVQFAVADRGGERRQSGTLLDGRDVVRFVVSSDPAASSPTVDAAWIERRAGAFTLHAGAGRTLADAVRAPTSLAIGADAGDLAVTSGASPWLAWNEATPEGARVVRVAPFSCK